MHLVPIPEIPGTLDPATQAVLKAMKQNLDVLTGQADDRLYRALLHINLNVGDVDPQQSAYSAAAPTKSEFDKAIDDIAALRDRLNYLLARMRGEEPGT